MSAPRKIRLSTTPTPEALAEIKLGDIVFAFWELNLPRKDTVSELLNAF